MSERVDAGATAQTAAEPETTSDRAPATAGEPEAPELVVADLLVEDVSIDGMCGVY
jgi:mycofactocin precursor